MKVSGTRRGHQPEAQAPYHHCQVDHWSLDSQKDVETRIEPNSRGSIAEAEPQNNTSIESLEFGSSPTSDKAIRSATEVPAINDKFSSKLWLLKSKSQTCGCLGDNRLKGQGMDCLKYLQTSRCLLVGLGDEECIPICKSNE